MTYFVKYKSSPWGKYKKSKIKSKINGEIDIIDLRKKTNGGYICYVKKYKKNGKKTK